MPNIENSRSAKLDAIFGTPLFAVLLAIGFAFAKPVLRWYLAMQKRYSAQEKAQAKENGAAPKEHDTADRTPSGDGADHITI